MKSLQMLETYNNAYTNIYGIPAVGVEEVSNESSIAIDELLHFYPRVFDVVVEDIMERSDYFYAR